MKKINLLLLIIFIMTKMYSQENKLDTIIKVKGEKVIVKINKVTDYDVSYTFPGESVIYTISKNSILLLKFSSGRLEKVTTPILINSIDDWRKVNTSTVPSDIKGLILVGEVSATGRHRNSKKADDKATEKIKKQAASLGAHIILIESKVINYNVLEIIGKAYKY